MKRLVALTTTLTILALIIAGCVGINKAALENQAVMMEGLRIPMVVTAEEANLYDQNTVIGKLPVGTKVYVLHKGSTWYTVEVPIDKYSMKIIGSMDADVLAPIPETKSDVSQETTISVSPTYSAIREKLWTEFFPEVGINTIASTADTIWLGTDSGLYKFPADAPGQAIKYTATDGLPDDDVQSIGLYKDEVWVGTYLGLSKFVNSDFINYTISDGLLKGAIMAIDVNDKYVWLGLTSGISRLDKVTGTFENRPHGGGWSPESGSGSAPASGKSGIYADSIAIDGDCVWNAAFNLTKTSLDGIDLKTYGCGDGLIHSRVVDFAIDKDDIWASTLWGVTRLEKNSVKYEQFRIAYGLDGQENPIIASVKDGDSLWIAMREGIVRLDTNKKKFVTYYAVWDLFGGRYISTLAADAKYLWVGTSEGLWRMDKAVANSISDEALVDDFESENRIRARGWNLGKQDWKYGSQNVFVDETAGASGTSSSLCIEYVAPDYKHNNLGSSGVNISAMDLTEYDGISFFIKAKPAVQLNADIGEISETWAVGNWNVPGEWMQIRVPFGQFHVHAQGSGNSVIELHAFNYLSFGSHRSYGVGAKPAPGEKGKIWIDEIRFYKNEDINKIASRY
ncbi:hypothetical protein FJZ31_03995 [Candidatus Poribacteria bacterium]|nr:hypothetical protein [Candidatus Poribacteria bacterium]